jgi:hypothetical protein
MQIVQAVARPAACARDAWRDTGAEVAGMHQTELQLLHVPHTQQPSGALMPPVQHIAVSHLSVALSPISRDNGMGIAADVHQAAVAILCSVIMR